MPDHKTVTFDASQWQLVPKTITKAMIENVAAFGKEDGSNGYNAAHGLGFGDSWADALAAAPAPAAQSADHFRQMTDMVDHSGEATEKVSNHVADVRNMVAAQSAGREAVAWLVTWKVGDEEWVDAYASELPAIDLAKRNGGIVTPTYAAPVNASEQVAIRYPDACIPQTDDSSFEFAYGWNSALVRFKAMNAAPVNAPLPDWFGTSYVPPEAAPVNGGERDKCECCNGRGEVGGLLPAGGGYESEECPECKGSGERIALCGVGPDEYQETALCGECGGSGERPRAADAPQVGGDDLTLSQEATVLASILRGMIEGGSYDDPAKLYAENFEAEDGDVFVRRAADVLDALSRATLTSPAKEPPLDDESYRLLMLYGDDETKARYAVPAKVGGGERLTNAAIKAIADRYSSFVSLGVYDETRYDCTEDFYNFCRELILAARSADDGYEPQQKQYSGLRLKRLAKAIGVESVIPDEWSPEDVDAGRFSILGMLAGHAERAALSADGYTIPPGYRLQPLSEYEAFREVALSADGGEDARDEFIRDVSKQRPEKPDYWSSCGQCQSNIDRAQDLIDAATPT